MLVATSVPCLDQTLQEATRALIIDSSPDRSGRCSKGSYVLSESEDIDLK